MRFATSPEATPPPPPQETTVWRHGLIVASLVGVLCTARPWTEVRFARLFGELDGPPAWQSTTGFTCFATFALVLVVTLVETTHRRSHDAVRPASLLLAAVAALALGSAWLAGPGQLRGVSASWTPWFHGGCAAMLGVLGLAVVRWRAWLRPAARRLA
jgi:hypothetical protein